LRRIDIADKDVSVVSAADFVIVNILGAQRGGEAVDSSVGFLRNGLLDLDLENEMCAALEVKAEFDLPAEIVLDLRQRSRKVRIAEQKVGAEDDDCNDEQRSPLQIRVQG